MTPEEFAQNVQDSPGCGQAHPDEELATLERADGGEGVICQSHASGLHAFYEEAANVLYEWGDE